MSKDGSNTETNPKKKAKESFDGIQDMKTNDSLHKIGEISSASTHSVKDGTTKAPNSINMSTRVNIDQFSQDENTLILRYGDVEMNQVFGSQSVLSQEIENINESSLLSQDKDSSSTIIRQWSPSPPQRKRKLKETMKVTDRDRMNSEQEPKNIHSQLMNVHNPSHSNDIMATLTEEKSLSGYDVLLDAARILGKIDDSSSNIQATVNASQEAAYVDNDTAENDPSVEGALPHHGHNTRTGGKRVVVATSLHGANQRLLSPSHGKSKNVTKESIIQARVMEKKKSEIQSLQKFHLGQKSELEQVAKRAAEIVEHIDKNPKVKKQLLLSMTLTRENPRTMPETYPPKGTIIGKGFLWNTFPPLVQLMRDHMEEYYEYSIERCQSSLQQEFNNRLVQKIKETSKNYGWVFDEGELPLKEIRDRIRNWYKSNISNATRRLKTMMKNPTRPMNAKALVAHLDMIVLHEETRKQLEMADEFMEDRGSTIVKQSGVKADDTDKDAAAVVSLIKSYMISLTRLAHNFTFKLTHHLLI